MSRRSRTLIQSRYDDAIKIERKQGVAIDGNFGSKEWKTIHEIVPCLMEHKTIMRQNTELGMIPVHTQVLWLDPGYVQDNDRVTLSSDGKRYIIDKVTPMKDRGSRVRSRSTVHHVEAEIVREN
jgi:hypothetical protein